MIRLVPRSLIGRLLALVAILIVLFLAATARLFIWPQTDAPARVDAIVALDGYPSRTGKALSLARAGYAPNVLLSVVTYKTPACRQKIPGVRIVCFMPNPVDTRGEAEFVSRFADERGWTSLIVVSSVPQTTRARMIVGRCFAGRILMVPVPVPTSRLPWAIAYEWGAFTKALLFERHC